MKKFNNDSDGITKVDLSKQQKPEEDAVSERKTEEVPMGERTTDSKGVGEQESNEQKEDVSVKKEGPFKMKKHRYLKK